MVSDLAYKEPLDDYYTDDWDRRNFIYEAEDVEVFTIYRKADHKLVVMKRSKFTTEDGNPKARTEPDWLNEANILTLTKNHPEILNIYDAFTFDRSIFIVTERCICDLQKLIDYKVRRNEFFTEKQIRTGLAQILQALLVMHSHKLMHRDLKPKNILVKSLHPL